MLGPEIADLPVESGPVLKPANLGKWVIEPLLVLYAVRSTS